MRPPFIIGLDVDEVLGDLHTPWVSWANRLYGTKVQVRDFSHWDFPRDAWGERSFDFLQASIYDNNIVKPYDGALAAVNTLRERGHHIRFVTSVVPNTESAKFEWLVRHGFAKAGDEYLPGKDKRNAPVHVLVDDGFHNVSSFYGWSILVNRPHNLRDRWCGLRISHVADLLNIF